MEPSEVVDDLEAHFNDVVSRLTSKQFFQSEWDIISFAVFFAFFGEHWERGRELGDG